jgi:ketosteroid isomerase-like protein
VSEQNVEIVRRAYAHTQATGRVYAQVMAPDFVWDMSKFPWPEQQLYEGAHGAQAFLDDWTDVWEDWEFEVEAFHDAGDKVVAVLRQRGRAKATGMPADMTFAKVWTVREGKLTRMEMYADPAEALKAVNLEK